MTRESKWVGVLLLAVLGGQACDSCRSWKAMELQTVPGTIDGVRFTVKAPIDSVHIAEKHEVTWDRRERGGGCGGIHFWGPKLIISRVRGAFPTSVAAARKRARNSLNAQDRLVTAEAVSGGFLVVMLSEDRRTMRVRLWRRKGPAQLQCRVALGLRGEGEHHLRGQADLEKYLTGICQSLTLTP